MLDFGCGQGWQAVALKKLGVAEMWGIDIVPRNLGSGRALAAKEQVDVHFVDSIPERMMGAFDVVLSISAFEHFADPESVLRLVRSFASPAGRIIISWAEPWYSHSGSRGPISRFRGVIYYSPIGRCSLSGRNLEVTGQPEFKISKAASTR